MDPNYLVGPFALELEFNDRENIKEMREIGSGHFLIDRGRYMFKSRQQRHFNRALIISLNFPNPFLLSSMS